IYGEVERHLGVTLEALDRDGRLYKVELSGFKARAAQHEIDHLDGVLFLDHLSAVKRGLLLAKWKKARKGQSGYVKDVTPEPAVGPERRGAAPVEWAILNALTQTGVTIMQMDEGLDSGPILLQIPHDVDPDVTGGELSEHLSEMGAQALVEALALFQANGLEP